MNFRSRTALQHPGIQLAPLVDVLMLLLIFFLLTWSAARNENELDVKVPKASDGTVIVNRRSMTGSELSKLLQELVKLYPEQAVVIRGDEGGAYKNVVNVLNICSESGITNVAFATAK
jgi:biopolymer transport protein ExbD